jgi:hypothetical protein
MSLKLNLKNKKKKKSTKLPKTKDGKLTYQLNRISWAHDRLDEIDKLNTDQLKSWKSEMKRKDDCDGPTKPKRTRASQAAAAAAAEAAAQQSSADAPQLYLASNPAADDSLELNSLDYLLHEEPTLPLRVPALFVLCSACSEPVSTGAAGHMTPVNGRFRYQHAVCQKLQ